MRIFVNFYSEINLGDDLFIKILLERYSDVNFDIFATKEYERIFCMYKNFNIVENTTVVRLSFCQRVIFFLERLFFKKKFIEKLNLKVSNIFNSKIGQGNIFLTIGGSMFIQRKKMPSYYDIVFYKYALQNFEKIIFLGCNFGPFTDKKYLDGYKEIFNKSIDVSFRDNNSKKMFEEFGNVRINPDIVFGLNFQSSNKKYKTIGFSIVNKGTIPDKGSYLRKFVELIKFYQKENYEIYLFSFCKSEGDEEIIEELLKLVDDKGDINKVFYDGDIEKFLKVYSSIEKMYCGRFHAMILSMLFEQKILPVVYSDKMTNVLKDIKFKGNAVKVENFHIFQVNEMNDYLENNSYNIDFQKQESEKHFEILDRVLLE